jgi:hypothetical protein
MKFFTPERYSRLGRLDDERSFLDAQEDWERALQGYQEHLRGIRETIPPSLRRLTESVYLHDARVLDMWQGQVSRCTITLQPESTPSQLVVLAYSLVEAPVVQKEVLPAESRSEPVTWLYDELHVESADGSTFTHDILLSNGWEVRLRFRNVTVTRPQALLPTARAAPTATAVSHSA